MVRASWAKTIVSAAKRLEVPHRESALRAISEGARDKVRNAGKLGFIEAEVMMDLLVSIDAGFGDAAEQVWVDAMKLAIEAPLLRPLKRGAFSMFGHDPAKLVKMTPHVWSLLTRRCGTCTYAALAPDGGGAREDDEGGARLSLSELAAPLRRSPVFAQGVAGAARAMIELCGKAPRQRLRLDDLAEGRAHLEFHWS